MCLGVNHRVSALREMEEDFAVTVVPDQLRLNAKPSCLVVFFRRWMLPGAAARLFAKNIPSCNRGRVGETLVGEVMGVEPAIIRRNFEIFHGAPLKSVASGRIMVLVYATL